MRVSLCLLSPDYEYALPCESPLVLGGEVPGVKVGVRPGVAPSPSKTADSVTLGPATIRGEPSPEGGPTYFRDCTLTFKAAEGLSSTTPARSCSGGRMETGSSTSSSTLAGR